MNNELQTDAVLLDLTKTFDMVPHDVLCCKLYYSGIKSSILVDSTLFESGPTIFCYINNMSDHVRNYYADTLICRPIITCEDCEMLQNELDLIQSRANKCVF